VKEWREEVAIAEKKIVSQRRVKPLEQENDM
jgi:hypothetical protein